MTQFRSSAWMRLVSLALVSLMMTGVVGVGSAWAEHQLLYPYWIFQTNVTTFVTVIEPNISTTSPVHYQYHSKLLTASNTDACESYSTVGRTSKNDILTYDVSGGLSKEPLLFDTTSSSLGGLGLNVVTGGPSHGYLIVENTGLEQPLYGEAFIVDIASGGTWGYNALTMLVNDDGRGIDGYHALLTGTRKPVQLLPQSLATEDFVVTPLGSSMRVSSANRAAFQLQLTAPFPLGGPDGGVYDRNENPIDFTLRPGVQCVGVLTYAQLISAGVLANAVWAQQGGWGWLANRDVSIGGTLFSGNAVVFKRIRSSVFGPFVVDAQPVVTNRCAGCAGGPVLPANTTGQDLALP